MAGHIATAAKTDWCTPPEIYLPVVKFFGQIDLDPCSNPKSGVPANVRLMLEKNENGLEKDWALYTTREYFGTRVYCNPPFGRGLRAWVEKAHKGTQYPNMVETILLIPAAVGTKLWQELVFQWAFAVCFLKGRVKFQGATASAPMDCALVYFGPNSEKFEDEFKSLGEVWNMVGECC
jgi:site-specific DNA-methyltransferase (adenine-specific)